MRRGLMIALVGAMIAALMPGAAGARNDGPKHQKNDYTTFVDETWEARPGATGYQGVHAGAVYRMEVPADWNGDLVVWAHGYRGAASTGDTVLFTEDHPLRDLLLSLGYAWAASSYSKNDYNVGTAVLDTHRMVQKFGSLVGKPDKTYLTGASMGGHVTAVSIEQFPNTYDAAMPICGVVGDGKLFDYFADFNLSAQYLGGASQVGFPIDDPLRWLVSDIPTMQANLEAVPGAWPAVLNADGEKLKAVTEIRSGGERPNFDQAWLFWNGALPAPTPQDFLFELAIDTQTVPANGVGAFNDDVVYQFDSDPELTAAEEEFNENVYRQSADPQSDHPNGLAAVPRISGDISVPVLTLHNLGDLFVPFFNEILYAQDVAANGASDLLVQRAIRGVGHCDFVGQELATAFLDLVAWVETGVRPEGDVVLDPAVVAEPDYGCTYTVSGHLLEGPLDLLAGCPSP